MSELRKAAEQALNILASDGQWGIFNAKLILKKALEQPKSKCQCGLNAGDGCQYCNRELHIETLEQLVADLEDELKEKPQNVRRLSDDDVEDARKLLSRHLCYEVSELTMKDVASTIMDACNIPKG